MTSSIHHGHEILSPAATAASTTRGNPSPVVAESLYPMLLFWLTSKYPEVLAFIQRLPTGTTLSFLLCFAIASLIGKAVGTIVNNRVAAKGKQEQTSAQNHLKRRQTSKSKTKESSQPSSSERKMTHEDNEPRKEGVASPEELRSFVEKAGDRLLVIDTRTTNFDAEPGDKKSLELAGLPTKSYRIKAKNLVWDRANGTMPELPADIPKNTPIITHCGAGGRGQLAKEFLEKQGFSNVINGGGPKEKECWAVYGDK